MRENAAAAVFLAVLVCIMTISCTAHPVSYPDVTPSIYSRETVHSLFESGQFEKLDAMAEGFRKSRETLSNGRWALTQFYYDLTGWDNPDYEKLIKACENWAKDHPDSPTPYIALSRLYRLWAFEARGGELARNVKEEQWKVFHERMQKSYGYAYNKAAARDIRSYAERIHGLRAIGGREAKEKAYEVFEQGYRLEPDYDAMYIAMAELLMDRWHGERGEIKRFLTTYANKRGGIEGRILFINTLFYMQRYYEPFNYLNRIEVSWEDLELMHKYVLSKQPDNHFILNSYWLFAGIALDLKKAEEIGRRLDAAGGWSDVLVQENSDLVRKLKTLILRQNQTAAFSLDASSIYERGRDLALTCTARTADGRMSKLIKKETLSNVNISLKLDVRNLVAYAVVPRTMLSRTVSVTCAIENPSSAKRVEAVKTIGPLEAAALEAVYCRQGNLLENPSAEQGDKAWNLYGVGGVISRGGNSMLYTEGGVEQRGQYHQDVVLPYGCEEGYLVMAGYASVDRTDEGSIMWHPYLNGYAMYGSGMISSYLNQSSLLHDCGAGCWQAVGGVFEIPAGTSEVRFFLSQASTRNGPPGAVRAYFDDLELRVFNSRSDAEAFINIYGSTRRQ